MGLATTSLIDFNELLLSELISKDVLTVYEGWSIKKLASFFVKHHISGAPVIAADNELVGVVTQSDVVAFESRTPSEDEIKKMLYDICGPNSEVSNTLDLQRLQEKANEYCTANSIMTHEVMSVDIATDMKDVCKFIVERNIHRLFVTENNRLVGVVSAMDILKRLIKT